MKTTSKFGLTSLVAILCTTSFVLSQEKNCGPADQNKASCQITAENDKTSGCKPSSCRGAQTKFGEAKAITLLRQELISLKARMEQSSNPIFTPRSYDIHGIVGVTDEESLQIIAEEVKIIEQEFEQKKLYQATGMVSVKNKAKVLQQLQNKILALDKALY